MFFGCVGALQSLSNAQVLVADGPNNDSDSADGNSASASKRIRRDQTSKSTPQAGSKEVMGTILNNKALAMFCLSKPLGEILATLKQVLLPICPAATTLLLSCQREVFDPRSILCLWGCFLGSRYWVTNARHGIQFRTALLQQRSSCLGVSCVVPSSWHQSCVRPSPKGCCNFASMIVCHTTNALLFFGVVVVVVFVVASQAGS